MVPRSDRIARRISESAGHIQHAAGDVSGGIAAQPEDRTGDLFRLRTAAQRNALRHPINPPRLAAIRMHVGISGTRTYAGYPDPLCGHLARQPAGQRIHRRF